MVLVNIRKPLYGNFVYIRDLFLNTAISTHQNIQITIPNGTSIIDPLVWKLNAIKNNRVMKKVFNFPDRPMILYGGNVKLNDIKGVVLTETPKSNFQQLSLVT